MNSLLQRLQEVNHDISTFCENYNRHPDQVSLLAVSKTRSADEILAVHQQGQTSFGESYIQEALEKIQSLQDYPIEWHFIGRIQSNKTRHIAENFDWVHSLDSLKHAERLNQQRSKPQALNVCIQINIDEEQSKGGIQPEELPDWLKSISNMPNLRLRGFMCIPQATDDFMQQRQTFHKIHDLFKQYQTTNPNLDTLSMGMSGDMQAAIAEGSTIVRIGTAIFGPRNYAKPNH